MGREVIRPDMFKSFTPTPKIVGYVVLYDNPFHLEREVVDKLKDGWQLYGTPFVRYVEDSDEVFQAMVKYSGE